MYFKNDLNSIKRQMECSIMFYKAAADAWDKVVIKRKKNGDDFADIGRAIEGARVYKSYNFDEKPQAHIYITTGRNEDTTVELWGYCDELPKDDPRHDTPNNPTWSRAKYTLTAAELEKRIAARVSYYREYAAELERELLRADELFAEYRNAIKAAEDKLADELQHYKRVDGDIHTSTLYWKITELQR